MTPPRLIIPAPLFPSLPSAYPRPTVVSVLPSLAVVADVAVTRTILPPGRSDKALQEAQPQLHCVLAVELDIVLLESEVGHEFPGRSIHPRVCDNACIHTL
jgi:hypothetical protein